MQTNPIFKPVLHQYLAFSQSVLKQQEALLKTVLEQIEAAMKAGKQ